MANGLLGKKAIPANTDHAVYTVPAATVATFNINLCNRTGSPITARLSIGPAVPTDDDAIEYDVVIPENDVLERTGLVASAGEKVVVRAPVAGLTARVMGFEEAA